MHLLTLSAALIIGLSFPVHTFAAGPSPEPSAKPSPPPADYDMKWGVKIPMRDKVELNATLYLPHNSNGGTSRTPVVFTLTPYISDSYHPRGAYFASHGYAFAIVDVRGRGNSGGDFEPFAQEPRDGHDIAEWLAQQPFCDGKVAMWGGSYAGFDQWAAAKEFPPHLATIVPVAGAHPGLDYPSTNNVGQKYDVQWYTFTSGKAGQINIFGDDKFWRKKNLESYRQHIPFNALDTFITGSPSANFQRILKHPMVDAYYDAMIPNKDQYSKLTLPILTITGQYDGDEEGAMDYYRNHMANAPADVKAKHFLIIGPWDHAGTRTPTAETGGVQLGSASMLDMNDLHRQWYDWTMKSGPRPEFLKKQVTYYVLPAGNSGANSEWRNADSLDEVTAGARAFYLDSVNGDANGVFRSGRLSETKPGDGSDKYTYDPLDLRRGEIEATVADDKKQNLDQRYALSIGEDGLIYHTDALPEERPLIGCPVVTLYLSVDTPDTDLSADLYEIQPDGTSIALWSDIRRLRYRDSLREAKLVRPGEIVKCEFNPGTFVGRQLMKGSRLRLIISSPNSINIQKNYNSGGVVAEEMQKDAHTAHVRIYHDAEHASSIQLPLR